MNMNKPYEFPPITLFKQGDSGSVVRMRALVDTEAFQKSEPLVIPVGTQADGQPVFFDIAKMPHLLIAGRSGAGKSMWLHSVITGLLCKNSPHRVNLLLIDPKYTEFGDYRDLPHLAVPVARGETKGVEALRWAVTEMERRFDLIRSVGVRDLAGYNRAAKDDPDMEHLSQVVIIIDELADLMMTAPDQVEGAICRLLQMGRAVGMHLLIATQCPRPDILTVLIAANIPTRIAFAVASQEDSCCILETAGAETLNGRGDMLFLPIGTSNPIRLQGAYVSGDETERIVAFIKEHNGEKTE